MTTTTLHDTRAYVEALASEDGGYYLVCGRTGERPVPATDLRFDSRTTARVAARVAEQYRTHLREYDSRLPNYDIVVCQDVAGTTAGESAVLASPPEGFR